MDARRSLDATVATDGEERVLASSPGYVDPTEGRCSTPVMPEDDHVDHSYCEPLRDHAGGDASRVTPNTVRRKAQSVRSNASSRESQRRLKQCEAEVQLAELDATIQRAQAKKVVLKKKLAHDMARMAADDEGGDESSTRSRLVQMDRTEEWVRRGGGTDALLARPRPLNSHAPTHKNKNEKPLLRNQPESGTLTGYRNLPSRPPTSEEYIVHMNRLVEAVTTGRSSRPRPKQTYELPTFTGNPADWLAFRRTYYNSTKMYNFEAFENIARLQAALQGVAKMAVEDLLRACDEPEEIMKVLEEEFGHPTLLLECAMNKVRELPRVTDSGRELRGFTAVVKNCVSLLRAVRADGYLNNPQVVSDILNKLTPYQRAQYGEFIMKKDISSDVDLRVSPSLELVVEFLGQLSRASVYYAPANPFTLPVQNVPVRASREQKRSVRPVQHKVMTQAEATSSVDRKDNGSSARAETVVKDCKCVLCNLPHQLPQCEQFRKMTTRDRWKLVKDRKLCFKCLLGSHSRKYCKAKRCSRCRWPHHTLLHEDRPAAGSSASANPERTEEAVTTMGGERTRALLKVLPVTIIDDDGRETPTYALLDDGATISVVDESCVEGIGGPVAPLRLVTAGGNIVEDNQSRRVKIKLRGTNGECHVVSVRTMHNAELPVHTLPACVLEANPHLRALDCVAMEGVRPMLLLGQDNWELIVGTEVRKGKSGKPVASLTQLGWVVHGPVGTVSGPIEMVNCVQVSDASLHSLVKAQFELEAIGVSKVPRRNAENDQAMRILESTARRVEGGWEVGLLWNRAAVEMPDNHAYARRRLLGIERKMDADAEYASAYCAQIDRLVKEGYAHKVTDGVKNSPVWYLPHFGVKNPNKPGKLRLVYDAAAEYQGTSLNDRLFSGPDLLNSLLGILFRFRSGPIAFTGDIMDMFLRVKIREADRGAQLFLWRGMERSREPDVYVMTSMIFGATSSPCSANYVLRRNADEFRDTYPEAVSAVHDKHYMDDYLDSVSTVAEARKLIEEVSTIHREGGFNIRGWVSNSSELRKQLPEVTAEPTRIEEGKLSSEQERTLGMMWSPESDTFSFDLSFKRLPPDIVEGHVTPTKRQFLSFVMSIFDPLGLASPCTIQSRILMQRIWRSGIGWDEQLKELEKELWEKWLKDLQLLREVSIARWYRITGDEVELHVFADASELAYAAVAYIVGAGEDGQRTVAMVAGKARVAPLKIVSIPRMELQAAVLACRLANTVVNEIGKSISSTTLWSDSRTVLAWIANDNRDYPKFVAHRLAEIDQCVSRGNWRWVPSQNNPADEATKLVWPGGRSNWVAGPPFLRCPQEQWPGVGTEGMQPVEEDEGTIAFVNVVDEPKSPLIDAARHSSWSRALRVVARVICFTRTCRGRRSAGITAEDLREAELRLLVQSQAASFSKELSALRAGRALPADSRLRALDPMIFDDGLLRVRGRLSAAPDLSFDERHPVILDGRDHLTRLLVRSYHVRALHSNHEAVLNQMRERFWILRGRTTVRAVVARCQLCRIRHAKHTQPKMGDLPAIRTLNTRRAFVHCGVDYYGPMQVAIGRRREKRWGVLFTCMVTRAVHLDLAATLDASSAIMALRRLIARRGQPARMYSDRGTNFVGANRELRAALQTLDHDRVREAAENRGIQWTFNPPAAPHMGGCWERLVRSVKEALKVTLRERAPREEVLQTLLAEAELVVNSRPLAYVADDPDEPVVITPNHLLLGTAAGDTGLCAADPADLNARAQWKRANVLADMFWRRWLRQYLPTLQRRQKWTLDSPPVRIGDVVVISDGNLPRNMWPKGIVKKVYPGSDGHIRVVDVRTSTGVLRRPVVKIIVLPTDGMLLG
ncbi:uncharacterized protein LOC126380224 [Pectinophora gossypiella]|uniref:uncharacterized protein LOC126380224 n=1 Tax=Pectinophora gossypiella TaxID=13191 RepID=UPI00214E1ABB|nr:uncharacterized protein LOC126380224 [Pectinophora gossypiella]